MTMTSAIAARAQSPLVPVALLLALLGLIGGELALATAEGPPVADRMAPPATVTVPVRSFAYRPAGSFVREGVPIDAPLASISDAQPLEIMVHQVSAADYARCVADKMCTAAAPRRRAEGDVPVTGVSFDDAQAYAVWLSAATGLRWRLPTEAEWVQAAGSKFVDDALNIETDAGNPAERWIANYEREAALGDGAIADVLPRGSFGRNEYGVADFAGSVWEWTSTCDSRTRLDADGNVLSTLQSCGVRILEGRHRSGMSTFVRDGRSGACSVGAPPDNLGFRLVRDRDDLDLVAWLTSLFV